MKIIVCIKQVPDTSDIKWTENNTIQREGLESVMNPYDAYALDFALAIKEKNSDVKVTALSMGPKQAERVLKRALALGADDAVLLSDKKFSGADTYATAKTIASAIKECFEHYDIILCGQFAIDGDTAQTGPSIASFLGLPQVTFVKGIEDCSQGYVTVIRETYEGSEKIKVKLPAVICMQKGESETSRITIKGAIKAKKSEILYKSIEDISLSPDEAGLKGSPTYVSKAFRAKQRDVECRYITTSEELVNVIKSVGGDNE